MVKSPKVAFIYRCTLVIIALLGVLLSVFIQGGDHPARMLVYFTVQSNLMVVIVYAVLTKRKLRVLRNPLSEEKPLHPIIYMGTLFTIMITFLVYTLLLSSLRFDMGGTSSEMGTVINIIVHYLVPILCIVDYLVFYPKGKTKYRYAVYWLLIPLIYFIFVCIRAQLGDVLYTIEYGGIAHQTYYPYPFIDVAYLGITQTIINALFLLFGFLVLGLLMAGADQLLIKNQQKQKKDLP